MGKVLKPFVLLNHPEQKFPLFSKGVSIARLKDVTIPDAQIVGVCVRSTGLDGTVLTRVLFGFSNTLSITVGTFVIGRQTPLQTLLMGTNSQLEIKDAMLNVASADEGPILLPPQDFLGKVFAITHTGRPASVSVKDAKDILSFKSNQ